MGKCYQAHSERRRVGALWQKGFINKADYGLGGNSRLHKRGDSQKKRKSSQRRTKREEPLSDRRGCGSCDEVLTFKARAGRN